LREKIAFGKKREIERCILVCVGNKNSALDKSSEYLDELELLAETAGAVAVARIVQKLIHPDPKTYLGKGKMDELSLMTKQEKVKLVIFDDELTPSQVRNIEGRLKEVKVLDRSGLILDIFAANAQTAQAKLQVELAQMRYLMPRLTRMWTHLSKQTGGIGTRGPGEKEIETDRRIVRNTIDDLQKKLDRIERQGNIQRKRRHEKINISLVGYTNAGKSSLLNALTKANVLAENKLFATLDATVRQWQIVDEEGKYYHFLLSDTVGFIRKLPHTLIECFKSTLAVADEANILLHVVDVSNPYFEDHIAVVKDTLAEIGVVDKPTILVLNKIDVLEEQEREEGEELIDFKNNWIANQEWPVVFVSAYKKTNLETLRDLILQESLKIVKRGIKKVQ
jgi:GTP-binding protein HflX